MSMIQPLGIQRETKFTDVRPGSRVLYTHNQGLQEPFEATVLETKEYWGQNAIPAHYYRRDGSMEQELMPANGTWRVQVLVDSKIMQPAVESPNTLHCTRRVQEITAIQFRGGIESAQEVIQFGAGKVNCSWRAGDAQAEEAIVISKASGDEVILAGSYLVIEGGTAAVYSSTQFGDLFEVDGVEGESADVEN